jgi:hypothetical protein
MPKNYAPPLYWYRKAGVARYDRTDTAVQASINGFRTKMRARSSSRGGSLHADEREIARRMVGVEAKTPRLALRASLPAGPAEGYAVFGLRPVHSCDGLHPVRTSPAEKNQWPERFKEAWETGYFFRVWM